MYSHCEEQQLSYITQEQQQQHNTTEGTEEDSDTGPNSDGDYCLPASFMGSQAWASEQTADSMALGKVFGKPSFFCTMTFNPNWPEI